MKPSGYKIIMIVILSALLVTACSAGASSPAATPTSTGDTVAGKTKYEGTCVACHGQDATGVTGLGKDLTTSEFLKDQSDAELVSFLLLGRPASDPANTTNVDMPPKGGNPALTDQDLQNIVAYLRTLRK